MTSLYDKATENAGAIFFLILALAAIILTAAYAIQNGRYIPTPSGGGKNTVLLFLAIIVVIYAIVITLNWKEEQK